MATMYNCEIRNLLGSTVTSATGASLDYRGGIRGIAVYIQEGNVGNGPALITTSAVNTFLSDLGYSNISDIDFSFNIGDFFGSGEDIYNPSVGFSAYLDDDTRVYYNGPRTDSSPIVDYYMNEIFGIRITFRATTATSTIANNYTHDISITATTFPKLRTLTDVRNFLVSVGFSAEDAPTLPTNQPVIYCETVTEDGSTSTSSSVNISSDFSTTTVTHTVVDNTGVSQDDFDALETKVQANTDWIAAQPAFWEQVINSLNNNVRGATDSAAETRDLLVALQLSTIPNIESRLSALENE